MKVYDKAKWHFGGDYPAELPIEQGYVHTGMFFTWIIINDLYSEELARDAPTAIEQVKTRVALGTALYMDLDGVLDSDMLSVAGNAFAEVYFDFSTGDFLKDYKATVGEHVPTLYHVPDTWETYDRLEPVLDARFQAWRQSRT